MFHSSVLYIASVLYITISITMQLFYDIHQKIVYLRSVPYVFNWIFTQDFTKSEILTSSHI